MDDFNEFYANVVNDIGYGLNDFFKRIQNDPKLSVLKHVDQYEKLQKIGQGTFGEVFKVRDIQTKKYYALKRIKLEQEKEGVI